MKYFIPIAALALVASAQQAFGGRICQNTDLSYGETDSANCGPSCRCAQYVPGDIETVQVSVEKTDPDGSDPVEVANFGLSNAGGQDTASGSLDNLDYGHYVVKVRASRADMANYVDTECSGALFEGVSLPTQVDDTTNAKVTIFMMACSPDITFSDTSGFTLPNYPSLTVSIVVSAPSTILGRGQTATITVQTSNVNNADTYRSTEVEASSTTFGTPASDHDWLLNDKSFKSATQSVVIPEGSTQADVTYFTGAAENTYTTTATIRSGAYEEGIEYPTKWGSQATVSFVVAPVGDLDLEIMVLSAVHPKVNGNVDPIGGVTAYTRDALYTRGAITSGTCATPMDDTDDFLIPGADASGTETTPTATTFTTSMTVQNIYGNNRDYSFTASAVSGDGTSSCGDVSVTLQVTTSFRGETPDCTNTGTNTVCTGKIEGTSTSISSGGYEDATIAFEITAGAPRNYNVFDFCSFSITTKTAKEGDLDDQNGVVRETDQIFNFVVGPHNLLCEGYGEVVSSNQTLVTTQKACPALHTIIWGSTSNFKDSIACNAASGSGGTAQSQEISLCALVTNTNTGASPSYSTADFAIDFNVLAGTGNDVPFAATSVTSISASADLATAGACKALVNSDLFVGDNRDPNATALLVTFTINEGDWAGKLICTDTDEDTEHFVRIKANGYGDDGNTDANTLCSETNLATTYTGDVDQGATVFCHGKIETSGGEGSCVADSKRRRKLLSAAPGCPDNSPFVCPASNTMPFDIKIEDGRLSVTMDTAALGGKTIEIQTNPSGVIPRRQKFLAADFRNIQSNWPVDLRGKLDLALTDSTMKQAIVPGATASDLMACCGFTASEAQTLATAMADIVSVEVQQIYKPIITIGGGNTNTDTASTGSQQQTTSTQTTTHTEKSSDDSSSSGSLLVVVAVAAVLVLVAVIALAIFTVKSNKQSQRVVDLRGGNDKQSSWQKGGAMESDF
jgi:hypothetical protein